jgi:transposase
LSEESANTPQGIMIYLDNVRPHNSRQNEAALTATEAGRVPAPACSPDLSTNDFFLFGMLKERMSGPSYGSPDELISAISELVASLSKDQLVNVYTNWMKHLNRVIKHRGEYYRK